MKKKKHYGTTGLFAEPIGKGLQQHHKKIFDKSALELVRLGTHWPEIMGEFLAPNSQPTKLQYIKGGQAILHIKTNPAIALEIQHMQPIILTRISSILGHQKVQRLKMVQ